MGKLYSSFRELLRNAFVLERALENYESYHAHTHPKKEPEKLHEHTTKVLESFLKLMEVHQIEDFVDSLVKEILKSVPFIQHEKEFGDYVKRLFLESVVFHDFGKINENFQVERMENDKFQPNTDNLISSYHSKLSAYLFLNYHFKNIYGPNNNLDDEEKALLCAFVYIFANPILKHHSTFFDHYIDFPKEEVDRLRSYLDQLDIDIDEELQQGFFKGYENIFKQFNSAFKGEDCFAIYALLKLNFSLLTSADFYATFAFRNDVEINDFGLLDDKLKENFSADFQSLKSYNKKVYENLEQYLNLPFENLQKRSNKNLNQLRQKLCAEVINNVRNNSSERLFYLEGPTGSGKTNLSLASVIELLQFNENLNKVFYVFPFTTLVTQTFDSVKETIGVTNDEVIQLHSKLGFHSKKEEGGDGLYGDEQMNYIDNLFLNYPITLLTHIKFFDVLKGNGKETNYLFHRLSNSIVIIDELQSYDPKHWDKVIFFLSKYAKHFNIRFILMSATLPKIDKLSKESKDEIVSLVDNKKEYFQNPNFSERVTFDFSLLETKWDKENGNYLDNLSELICQKSEEFASGNSGKVRVLVECIVKKTASKLYRKIQESEGFSSYEKYLISGEILEPRRKEIIGKIEQEKGDKVILVSTQVVEAGVDIDMDLGFKDRSLIDSDEQLAGRVNRNAGKENCKVYLFDYDPPYLVYKGDKRYEVTKREISRTDYEEILKNKDFDKLYDKVHQSIIKRNSDEYTKNFNDYVRNFRKLNFSNIKNEFQLIDDSSNSVYIPLEVPIVHFAEEELNFLSRFGLDITDEKINGGRVFEVYQSIIEENKRDFIKQKIDLKKIYGIMSRFMFSVFKTQEHMFRPYLQPDITEKFGILYLSAWNDIYSYEGGVDVDRVEGAVFI